MISFDEFLKQDECDKYNMLQECNAIIQQKENIIKEVRKVIIEYIEIIENGIDQGAYYVYIGNIQQKLYKCVEILDKTLD